MMRESALHCGQSLVGCGLKLQDTVALLVEVSGRSIDDREVQLSRGQVGTVMEARDADVVVVAFVGIDGVAYAIASVACANLLRLHHGKPAAGQLTVPHDNKPANL